jgi:Lrp/AsnC family transcriptional regulator for asnA, asnC and gidA
MGKINIDAIDRKILKYLVKNARMPFLEIARECGISGAAIHQRVKKLDDSGVIRGSGIDIDPASLGLSVCALIGIRLSDPSVVQNTIEKLRAINEITECHFITGAYNIFLKVHCTDNEHLMRVIFDRLYHIDGISSTETFISLNQPFSRQVNVDGIDLR